MTLFLDNIIFSLQKAGGISVCWSELLRRLLAEDDDIVCLERPDASRNLQRQTLVIPRASILRETAPLKLARYLPCYPSIAPGALFHSSYYRVSHTPGSINIVTVHDFVYEHFSTGLRRTVHSLQKGHAIRRADMILCVSENTRRDLLHFYPGTDENRVRVIPNAADRVFTPLPESTPAPPELAGFPCDRYLLYVGDRSSYKNFHLAVETAAHLPDTGLVVVGGKAFTAVEKQQLSRVLAGRYRHLTGAAAETLNILYNKAFCLLYPSSYEGFGIPPLEAMQAGCPVIAVRTSSLPEVCGDAALLAEKPSLDNFLALIKTLDRPAVYDEMRRRGIEQATRFSWDKTFAMTKACYEAMGSRTRCQAT